MFMCHNCGAKKLSVTLTTYAALNKGFREYILLIWDLDIYSITYSCTDEITNSSFISI